MTNRYSYQMRKLLDTFNNLFDIAYQGGMSMMTVSENREFLIAQHEEGRRAMMGGDDKILTERESKKEKSKWKEQSNGERSRNRATETPPKIFGYC